MSSEGGKGGKGGTATREPHIITTTLLRDWALPDAEGDKNSSGTVIVVGGNRGMPGAVLLAGQAAMRAGAGKLQLITVESVAAALGVSIPEAYVVGVAADGHGDLDGSAAEQIIEMAAEADAVVIGPGIMSPEASNRLLGEVIPHLDCALSLDALGLAYLTDNLDGVKHLAGRTVLSPNATELFKTLGETAPTNLNSAQGRDTLVDATLRLASTTGAVVVSGAEVSFIASPDGELWVDEGGGQGLAVSGSGDVKSGVIAGLLARGAAPEQAAVWAAAVHGRCGERLASAFGPRGFMASDLPPEIPAILAELQA
ncbi:MAG: NAD(P)H-hydrate dehydratase [bacterium]|nr:NAD(P)H-hydrate dehydratase [bacterium]